MLVIVGAHLVDGLVDGNKSLDHGKPSFDEPWAILNKLNHGKLSFDEP